MKKLPTSAGDGHPKTAPITVPQITHPLPRGSLAESQLATRKSTSTQASATQAEFGSDPGGLFGGDPGHPFRGVPRSTG